MLGQLFRSFFPRVDSQRADGTLSTPSPGFWAKARIWLLPVVLLWGLREFRGVLQVGFPLQSWLVWRYLMYWALSAAWVIACLAFGHAVVRRVLGTCLPVLEHLTMSFALGTLSFFMLMFAGGLCMAYGSVFFVALPLGMFAVGAKDFLKYVKRLLRHVRYTRARRPRGFSLVAALLWGAGVIALFLFYLPALVPAHIGYDSAWYHVPLAEHFAALGGIRRSPEGWYPATLAHLSSILYAWAFQLPKSDLFDRIELSAHIEFAVALMTLIGIPALVTRLVPRTRAHASWVAFFAFPCVYWYDLLIGGDQISALWAIPVVLGLLRTFPELSVRHGVLFAAAMAGVILTKYSSFGVLAIPLLALGVRGMGLGFQRWQSTRSLSQVWQTSRGSVWVPALLLLFTTPLWLKNWVWYRDPFHPVLHGLFASKPWSPDASLFYSAFQADLASFQPARNWQGFKETLAQIWTHSFLSSDFSGVAHGSAPFRGSLFTLLCLCLPFVKARGRVWAVALIGNVAIFTWYWMLHQDRYLMAIIPLMAAFVAALVILAWQTSLFARVAVVLLVAFHSLWGIRIFSLSWTNSQLRAVFDFIANTANSPTGPDMSTFGTWEQLRAQLPRDAKVLLHDTHLHTGIGRPTINDWPKLQSGISYASLPSAAALYRQLRTMGVTHVAWQPNDQFYEDSVPGDLRFYEFVSLYTNPIPVAGMLLGELPAASPPEHLKPETIAFFGCSDLFEAGLYPFSGMAIPFTNIPNRPPSPAPLQAFTANTNVEEATLQADFVVFRANCAFPRPTNLTSHFDRIGDRGVYELYAKKP